MSKLSAVLAAGALGAWAFTLAAQPPEAAPAAKSFGEQVDVDIVNVEVYVTDADGRPAGGLVRGDFTLLEDGKPVQVVNFDAVDRTTVSTNGGSTATPSPTETAPEAAATVAASDPLSLVVYVDNTHLAPGHRTRALAQLRDFLTRRLAAGDRVMLVSYDPGLHVRLPFTADREAIGQALDALEKLTGDGGGGDRSRRAALDLILSIQERALIAQEKQGAQQDRLDARFGEDGAPGQPETDTPCPPEIAEPVKSYAEGARNEVLRSITGLTVLVNSLSGLPGRKALLHLSDGLAVTPGEELFQALYEMCGGGGATSGPNGTPSVDGQRLSVRTYRASQAALDAQAYSTAKQWTALAAHASAQRVTLYTLQASGLEAGAASAADMGPGDRLMQISSVARIEAENRRGSLTALAKGTGGRAILDANDLRPEIARLEDDFSHYYSLGYTPPHAGDGRDHRIEVKLARPGLRVRHRQVYRAKPPLERVVDRTLAALFLGSGDNPLGVTVQVGDILPVGPAGSGSSVVPIRLLIPLANIGLSMRGEGYDGKLRVLVTTMSANGGGNSPVRQMEIPLRIPMAGSGATLMQSYLYEMKLQLPGEHQVAIGVRDDVTTLASFLAQKIQVGGGAAR